AAARVRPGREPAEQRPGGRGGRPARADRPDRPGPSHPRPTPPRDRPAAGGGLGAGGRGPCRAGGPGAARDLAAVAAAGAERRGRRPGAPAARAPARRDTVAMRATQAGGRFVRRLAGRLIKAPDDGSTTWETGG